MPANNSPRFTMRLEPDEMIAFRDYAESEGVTMAELVRPFILGLLRRKPADPRPHGRVPVQRKQ